MQSSTDQQLTELAHQVVQENPPLAIPVAPVVDNGNGQTKLVKEIFKGVVTCSVIGVGATLCIVNPFLGSAIVGASLISGAAGTYLGVKL